MFSQIFFLTCYRKEGGIRCRGPCCMWRWCEVQQTEDPKGVLTRANNLSQQLRINLGVLKSA